MQGVYAVDLCGGGFESVVVVWVSMWVPSVVVGFESVVVVWVLAGLLNRWWLWVVESVWAGFESLVLGSSDLSLFVGFG